MKGLALDQNGDLVIQNNEIQMIEDDDLTKQTVKTVLSTNKGEWAFNENEGINFDNIFGKKTDQSEELCKVEIEDGLKQVDENFLINTFSYGHTNRDVTVKFSFKDGDKETEVETKWA